MRFGVAAVAALFLLSGVRVEAQTTSLSPLPIQHFVDNNGNLCVGCKLFTYQAGTTTKQNTYTDSAGGTPNTNPVVMNARGEANVWLDPTLSYKFVLSPSTDSDPPTDPIWTVDQISTAVNSNQLTVALASPPPIGATTPSTGAFTTSSVASGVISGSTVWAAGIDASAGYTPGSALAMVAAIGDNNGIIGQVRNNVDFATNPFLPAGVTGYGQVPSGVASVAFGLYGLGELKNADGEAVGLEATAGMLGGGDAQVGPIPSFGDPTNHPIVDGAHITCRSQTGTGATGNCSLGLFISNENSGDTSK